MVRTIHACGFLYEGVNRYMIYIGENYDWNSNDDIPNDYLDNPNIEKLRKYKLPVIDNVAVLFRSLNLSVADAKKFFYSKYRRTLLYRSFELSKKKGGTRKISVPIPELMNVQKAINTVILNEFHMSSYCVGFKKNMSLVDNAKPHLGAQTLLKFDLKDFFGSITFEQVYKQFKFYGYGNLVSKLLCMLCLDGEFKVPQGAPTSPTLSNLVALKMDKRIGGYCAKRNLVYTRYADDISISSKNKLSKIDIACIHNVVKKIVEEEGFLLNEEKTHCFFEGQQMRITGVVINDNLIKPDLILVDGGLIQINACKEILDNLCLDIPVYGMQKNDKHRICALVSDEKEIEIEKDSNLFHFLEKISEEVHRFAISYHKEIRSKGSLSSVLDNIPGIGEKRRKALIKEFKNLKCIKNASDEELKKVLQEEVVQSLREYLKEDSK